VRVIREPKALTACAIHSRMKSALPHKPERDFTDR
jgi:hypothetical protein